MGTRSLAFASRQLSPPHPLFWSGAAQVWGWIVPGVHLIAPLLILLNLWKSSSHRRQSAGPNPASPWIYWSLTSGIIVVAGVLSAMADSGSTTVAINLSLDAFGAVGYGIHANHRSNR